MDFSWRKFSALAFIFLIFLTDVSARKKKTSENSDESSSESFQAVKIAVPERKEFSYFEGISPEILADVEKGSPESLRSAIAQLKRNRENMTEAEQVLHYIAVSIMQMC